MRWTHHWHYIFFLSIIRSLRMVMSLFKSLPVSLHRTTFTSPSSSASASFSSIVIRSYSQYSTRSHGLNRCHGRLVDIRCEIDGIVSRRSSIATVLSVCIASKLAAQNVAFAQPSLVFREYIDTFDGYSFNYPANWIPVKGAGADIFFRDPFVLDENLSVDISSPSSSKYKSVEDLGPPEIAAKNTLKQYLTEFMSTRLGVRRESNIISASSNVADDGRIYYQVEVNIKSYANTNELAIMPEERVLRLEWDRRYLSVLGVENNRLYELRLQTPEKVFQEEESDLRRVMDSFRVNKVLV